MNGMKMIIPMNVDPILFQLGPFTVRWYGFMISIGFLVAAYLTGKELKRRGFAEDVLYSVGIWVFIAGMLGVRLYYDIQTPQDYLHHPELLFAYTEGGLAIYGGIFFGIVAVLLFALVKKLPFFTLIDCIIPTVPIAQAIGRIGCTINGCASGDPSNLPFGITYSQPNSLAMVKGVALWPTSLFELVWDVLVFVLLWSFRKRVRRPGLLLAAYAVLYSIGRLWIGFFRSDSVTAFGLRQQQWTAIAIIVVGAGLWIYLKTRPALAPVFLTPAAPAAATDDGASDGDPLDESVVSGQ